MATASHHNPKLRVIPLADADIQGVEALFDEQCDEWRRLLKWDYRGPTNMIRKVVRKKELMGYAAVNGNIVVGVAFYVIDGERCSIGDIYVTRSWRGCEADRQLVEAVLDHIDRTPGIQRVESQSVSVGNDGADLAFLKRGFESFDRLYMMISTKTRTEPASSSPRAVRTGELFNLLIRSWEDADFAHAARIIHKSYSGEHDSRINSQYRTEEGCAELLAVLTDHLWCGEFLPSVSRVGLDQVRQKRVAILVASRIAQGTGHVGQISVLPDYQGKGLGRRMMLEALFEFAQCGFDTISLAVTGANTPAFRLYKSLGFQTVHRFHVFYRESS